MGNTGDRPVLEAGMPKRNDDVALLLSNIARMLALQDLSLIHI